MSTRLNDTDYRIIYGALASQRSANRTAMAEATEKGDFDTLQDLALQTARLDETQAKIAEKITDGTD